MKHTPGPWEWDTGSPNVLNAPRQSVSGSKIEQEATPVLMLTRAARAHMAEANARLIAAAPDLLQACKRSLHLVEENNEEVVKMVGAFGLLTDLQAAIAKAEGK